MTLLIRRIFFSVFGAVLLVLLPTALSTPAYAFSDVGTTDLVATGSPIAVQPVDPQIARALREIRSAHIQGMIEKLVSFKNRSTISSMEKDLPPGTGVTAAAQWIESELRADAKACSGCLEVKADTFTEPAQTGTGFGGGKPRIAQPTTITNVYAILRGSDPQQAKRMYLITGHYDTRVTDVMDTHSFAPGANDDSSGTAVSLECARVLSRYKFPATLVFVAVAGEEQGLNGSKHLAQLAKRESWQLEGVLNNDIVGGDTTPGDTLQDKHLVRVFSEPVPADATSEQTKRILSLGLDSDSPSRELAREIVAVDRTYFTPTARTPPGAPIPGLTPVFRPVLEFRLDRYLRGGDHRSFNEEGFAAVRFTEWRENFNHQHQNVRTENGIEYGDLLKFDDFGYIAKVAELNAATLATLASAPGEPDNVKVITKNLDNNTALKWSAPEGAPTGTQYQIVWRETSAPDWQYTAPASKYGDVGTGADHMATVPVSKDNAIFGVRSCDAAGHCSPAVVPFPER